MAHVVPYSSVIPEAHLNKVSTGFVGARRTIDLSCLSKGWRLCGGSKTAGDKLSRVSECKVLINKLFFLGIEICYNSSMELFSVSGRVGERGVKQTWKIYRASRALLGYFLAQVNFESEHMVFLSQMAEILSSMLYQAMRGNIILGWLTFPDYVTLPSHGYFYQTDVVYPALVWLPSLGKVTQAG